MVHDARKPRDVGTEYVLGRRLARLLLKYLPFQGGDPLLESGQPLTGLVRRSLAVFLLAEQGLARSLRIHQASELALDRAGDVVGMRHHKSQGGLEWQLLGEHPLPLFLASLGPLGLCCQVLLGFGPEDARLVEDLLRLLHGGRGPLGLRLGRVQLHVDCREARARVRAGTIAKHLPERRLRFTAAPVKGPENLTPLLELPRDRADLSLDAGHIVRGRRHDALRARHRALGVLEPLSRTLHTRPQARPPVRVVAQIRGKELADLLAESLDISLGLLESRLEARYRLVGCC